MYINKISIKTSKQVKQHGPKTKSIKNQTKKHYRKIMPGALPLYMSMTFSSCSSLRNFGPSRQIFIS